MLKNAYFLAKIGADTAENEQHYAEILPIGRRVADRPGRRCPGPGPGPAPGRVRAAAERLEAPRGPRVRGPAPHRPTYAAHQSR